MVYFALLVSDIYDIVLLQGVYCKKCVQKKLGYEVYDHWTVTENGFREWYKLLGRAIRMKKCDCNVGEKMKQLKINTRT
jgi:hypothetical protein